MSTRSRHILTWCRIVAAPLLTLLLATACRTTKHVPDGSYLLNDVDIRMEGPAEVSSSELVNYLKQTPNHEVLGFWKLQLNTYNLSGYDSTKRINRWLQSIGQAPVIYDSTLTRASARQLELAMINRGYMDATVAIDTLGRPDKKKMNVTYTISPGTPHRINSVKWEITDTALAAALSRDSLLLAIAEGELLDRDRLDAQRATIAQRLQNRGYFNFTKEYVTFTADTFPGSKNVDLTMHILPPKGDSIGVHPVYHIGRVTVVTNYHIGLTLRQAIKAATDSVEYKGIEFLYGNDNWIKPSTIEEKCFIQPDELYRANLIDRTYEYLSLLPIVKSTNIELVAAPTESDPYRLDAYIMLTRNPLQGVTFEVEGTNSEGDLGFGVGLTYQHRNVGRRSNLFTAKFRASYESISGNLDGLINDNYQEYAGELGLTFPKIEFPFIGNALSKRLKASTEVVLSGNYQARPEYTRVIAGATWRYKVNHRSGRIRHIFDLLNINYVYLPHSTIDFIDQIAPSNPLLRYSYEDHFIVNWGYSYYKTNRRLASTTATARRRPLQPVVYSFRVAAETAGNLLYAISHLANQKKEGGVYKLFGIQYSQYAKAEIDYSVVFNLNRRHAMAFRAGGGIGVPYGNSEALPFEKRFYAGGANGVRGWGVRTLGPGAFDGRNSQTDFINQCGDISLILSAEYRAKLFWVLEGALFVDAGNIWTIRSYPNQPGGVFRPKNFLKEIAGSYGIGLRADFQYFVLRFDLGMKAHNPALGQEPWPLVHPNWHRDATFHFAVGYPF